VIQEKAFFLSFSFPTSREEIVDFGTPVTVCRTRVPFPPLFFLLISRTGRNRSPTAHLFLQCIIIVFFLRWRHNSSNADSRSVFLVARNESLASLGTFPSLPPFFLQLFSLRHFPPEANVFVPPPFFFQKRSLPRVTRHPPS